MEDKMDTGVPSGRSSEDQEAGARAEQHCANACVRAGLTALVFSALAWAVTGAIQRQPAVTALASYLQLRLDLKEAVTGVESDRCWAQARAVLGDEIAKEWSLERLRSFRCGWTDDEVRQFAGKSTIPAPFSEAVVTFRQPPSAPGQPPAAPTDVRVTAPLYAALDLERTLRALADQNILELASETGNGMSISIRGWRNLSYRLFNESFSRGRKDSTTPFVVIMRDERGDSAPKKADLERMFLSLSFQNISELSQSEPIAIEAFDAAASSISRVKLPLLETALSLEVASVAVLVVIALSMAWLWLNLREIGRLQTQPRPGALMSMFGNGLAAKGIFALLVFAVASSAAVLAFKARSMQPLNLGLGFLTVLAARAAMEQTRWGWFGR